MCICSAFFREERRKSRRRGWWSCSLQPCTCSLSKSLYLFIKANQLKHVAWYLKTSRPSACWLTRSAFISLLLWPEDGTWPSNSMRNAQRWVQMRLDEKQRQQVRLKHLCRADRYSSQSGFFLTLLSCSAVHFHYLSVFNMMRQSPPNCRFQEKKRGYI